MLLHPRLLPWFAATPVGPGPHPGRTWADFASENATVTVVLAALGFALLLAGLIGLLAALSYRRSKKERREWTGLWGAFAIGAQAGGAADTPPATPGPNGSMALVARAAMRFVEAIPALSAAGASNQAEPEGKLLYSLVLMTRQSQGTVRRASILKVEARDKDAVMVLRRGYPEQAFSRSTEFSLTEYRQTGKGLCWEAAFKAQAAQGEVGAQPIVMTVADVGKHAAYLDSTKKAKIRSILIAPILSGEEIRGAICLDADEPDYYGESDRAVVAIVSSCLKAAWEMGISPRRGSGQGG